jgi:hypothetical protein
MSKILKNELLEHIDDAWIALSNCKVAHVEDNREKLRARLLETWERLDDLRALPRSAFHGNIPGRYFSKLVNVHRQASEMLDTFELAPAVKQMTEDEKEKLEQCLHIVRSMPSFARKEK